MPKETCLIISHTWSQPVSSYRRWNLSRTPVIPVSGHVAFLQVMSYFGGWRREAPPQRSERIVSTVHRRLNRSTKSTVSCKTPLEIHGNRFMLCGKEMAVHVRSKLRNLILIQ